MIHIDVYQDDLHRQQVVALWAEAFGPGKGHNEARLSIDKKLAVADGLFFVALDGATVVGTTLCGYDGHRGWLYAVAVTAGRRGSGIGAALVKHAERALAQQGCTKINLQVLGGNGAVAGFYRALGYSVEDRISLGRIVVENVPSLARDE